MHGEHLDEKGKTRNGMSSQRKPSWNSAPYIQKADWKKQTFLVGCLTRIRFPGSCVLSYLISVMELYQTPPDREDTRL